jgi:hypothetical protein
MGMCITKQESINLFPAATKTEHQMQKDFKKKINRGESEFGNYVLREIEKYGRTGNMPQINLEIHKPCRIERQTVLDLLTRQAWLVRMKIKRIRDGEICREIVDIKKQQRINNAKNLLKIEM